VEPRYGRLYASAVLRPLAEQVVSMLGVQPGETVCDLMCDGGTLGVALSAATGTQGSVVLVDIERDVLVRAAADVAQSGCVVSAKLASSGASPLLDASCDRVATLCTLGFWNGDSLFDVARRAMRPTGCAAVLTWSPGAPLHEMALEHALREVLGYSSPFLMKCLAPPDRHRDEDWESLSLHDVVRFDGIAMYWAALVTERPVAIELADQTDDALHALRAACQRALEPCTAADGTLRIPVHATLYRSVTKRSF
jgi:SAM-dependent methyltransferase